MMQRIKSVATAGPMPVAAAAAIIWRSSGDNSG
jgi:hypothetical protein